MQLPPFPLDRHFVRNYLVKCVKAGNWMKVDASMKVEHQALNLGKDDSPRVLILHAMQETQSHVLPQWMTAVVIAEIVVIESIYYQHQHWNQYNHRWFVVHRDE